MTTLEIEIDPPGVPHARATLDRARWVARRFARYDKASVDDAVAAAAAGAPTGLAAACHGDFVSTRSTGDGAIELPRPAGVVGALLPADASPYTAQGAVLFALLTRNAVVLVAEGPSAAAARAAGQAAVDAGAPDGVVQVLTPSAPVLDTVVTDADLLIGTDASAPLRVLTGAPVDDGQVGAAVVLVDTSADIAVAAASIASAPDGVHVVVTDAVAGALLAAVGDTVTLRRVRDVRAALQTVRSVVRAAGGVRAATIHSTDADTVADFVVATGSSRVVVNAAGDPGAEWSPLRPADLVRWTTVIGATPELRASVVTPDGPVPAYPTASNRS